MTEQGAHHAHDRVGDPTPEASHISPRVARNRAGVARFERREHGEFLLLALEIRVSRVASHVGMPYA